MASNLAFFIANLPFILTSQCDDSPRLNNNLLTYSLYPHRAKSYRIYAYENGQLSLAMGNSLSQSSMKYNTGHNWYISYPRNAYVSCNINQI